MLKTFMYFFKMFMVGLINVVQSITFEQMGGNEGLDGKN